MYEISQSFWTQKPSLRPDCCQAIKEVDEDCASTVFARFENPFLQYKLNVYCAQMSHSHHFSS